MNTQTDSTVFFSVCVCVCVLLCERMCVGLIILRLSAVRTWEGGILLSTYS